jgi:hypothetical protein
VTSTVGLPSTRRTGEAAPRSAAGSARLRLAAGSARLRLAAGSARLRLAAGSAGCGDREDKSPVLPESRTPQRSAPRSGAERSKRRNSGYECRRLSGFTSNEFFQQPVDMMPSHGIMSIASRFLRVRRRSYRTDERRASRIGRLMTRSSGDETHPPWRRGSLCCAATVRRRSWTPPR